MYRRPPNILKVRKKISVDQKKIYRIAVVDRATFKGSLIFTRTQVELAEISNCFQFE